MKKIRIGQTYNNDDLTQTGYDIEVSRQRDGKWMIIATGHSRWQGSITHDKYQIRDYVNKHDVIDAAKYIVESRGQDLGYDIEVSRQRDGKWIGVTTYHHHPIVRINSGIIVQ